MGACQHTSVDERCCQHQGGVDTHTHMKTCMGARVRAHPGLYHRAGMPSHDQGERAALNEFERHSGCLFLSRKHGARLRTGPGAAVSLEACFPRQGACLVFIVDTQAVWG